MAKQPARRTDVLDRDAPGPDGWHELAVANPTFSLERRGSECADLQGPRVLAADVDLLTRADGGDVANALLRAAWSAELEKTQVLLLDLLIATDAAATWEASG